ncbi:MAG: methyltransferase domain-containing protein [Pseudochelatococcus sp.]|jgi:SAM-dependent methyltransferase|uniref:class I SAM-dependent methyltransferase n=1 Tax=Pseudochelatococcus sp. TaxID=2020869 RepID=UPI003D92B636
MSADHFYREFEANFRGDREEILQRLKIYRPFIEPFLSAPGTRRVCDLGCGRGEWLEFMQSIGMEAHGVDLDEGMLLDCFERGLSAEQADAIAHLKSLADESQAIVSGFHIAEHLPFPVLRTLIDEALRVLRPGGLLILETPNAENIQVGTLSFHMDPTHVKPLPPGLLSFLPRFYGFHRSRVIRLQESEELRTRPTVRLLEVLRGVSPDYAVIAQKSGDPEWLAQFDAIFATDFGLTLDTLCERFDAGFVPAETFQRDMAAVAVRLHEHFERFEENEARLKDRLSDVENIYRRIEEHREENLGRLADHARRFDEQAHRLDEQARRVDEHGNRFDEQGRRFDGHARLLEEQNGRLEEHARRLDDQGERADALAGRLSELAEQLASLAGQNEAYRAQIAALHASTSWKVTAPLRLASRAGKNACATAVALPRACVMFLLRSLLSRRAARAWAWRLANRYPKTANRFRAWIYRGNDIAPQVVNQPIAQSVSGRHLSTRTRKIHEELLSRRNDRT